MQHYIEEIQIFGERYGWRLYQMIHQRIIIENNWRIINCMKSVRIWSFSGPYFPAFGMNTEKYGVSLSIQSKCGKVRTRKPQNTDTFHTVLILLSMWLNLTSLACFQRRRLKLVFYYNVHLFISTWSLQSCLVLLLRFSVTESKNVFSSVNNSVFDWKSLGELLT